VLATDASTAMLDVARQCWEGGDVEFRRVVLPDDPLPSADAVVSVGHALNYLHDAGAIDRALLAIAGSLRPGGVLAIDLCDFEYGEARRGAPPYSRVSDDWVLVARFSSPAPDRFVRDITTFVRDAGGGWRRDDERHENVLVDTSVAVSCLATAGVDAEIGPSFGAEPLPHGMRALVGRKR
jgi:SAM-dependent methyltransferase